MSEQQIPFRRRRTLGVLACVMLLVAAGCGGGSDDGSKDAAAGGGAGTLRHIDGVVQLDPTGEKITVTPEEGDAVALDLGPAIEQGTLQGLVASGAKARVFYEDDGGTLIAATVAAAPKLGEGVQAYKGIVVETEEGRIVVGGDEGDREFAIAPEDADQFDQDHMREHMESSEPIRIYYRTEAGVDRATAYEDA